MSINEKLRKYIKERGISKIFIAQETGLDIEIVSKILANKRKIKAYEFLLICNAIGVDIEVFRESKW